MPLGCGCQPAIVYWNLKKKSADRLPGYQTGSIVEFLIQISRQLFMHTSCACNVCGAH
jgi:hypothetical protein